jgi:hypothetical protein
MKTLVLCLNRLPEYKTIRITNEEDIHEYYIHIQSESYEKPFVYKQYNSTYCTINPRYVVYSYEEE